MKLLGSDQTVVSDLLLVSPEVPPLGGGTGKAVLKIAQAHARRGISVDLIGALPTQSAEPSFVRETDFTFRSVSIRKGSAQFWTLMELLQFLFKARRVIRRLWQRNHYDLIHTFLGFPSGLVAAIERLGPHVLSLRGSDVPGFSDRVDRLKWLTYPIYRAIWDQADCLVANNPRLQELARQFAPGETIHCVPNGVDTDRFSPHGDGDDSSPSDVVRYLFVGRLVERKNVAGLAKAFARLCRRSAEGPRPELTIAGEGPRKDEIRTILQARGVLDSVRFLGHVENQDLPPVYRRADVFVLPSEEEGMSNALLEAMSSGLPVIVSTNVGPELVPKDAEFGIRVEPEEEAMQRAMKSFRNQADELAHRGRRARDVIMPYSWGAVARQYRDLYRNVLFHESA